MVDASKLLNFLKKKINFFTGVPDSVLKNFTNILKEKSHIVATNEGSAVSLAIGNYLSTKKLSLVYMQNSGLGNALNPLISIAHQNVYSIPLILMIGWRGSPNTKDEPQHNVQGLITRKILNLLNIKFCIVDNDNDFKKINYLIKFSLKKKRPVAFLIKNNTLFLKKHSNNLKILKKDKFVLRSFVIEELLKRVNKNTRIISATGYTSRELNKIRKEKKYKKGKDFYMVGGMGHASMVSLGYSLSNNKQTICLDGDGSLLMHLGSMILASMKSKANFKHILLNNGCHESVGKQKIDTQKIDFRKIVYGFGYKKYFFADRESSFLKKINIFLKSKGPSFFEIYIQASSLKSLSRPNNLKEIKNIFINT